MSAVSARVLSRRCPERASPTSLLPHWSEVSREPRRHERASPSMTAILRDLVAWAADIAIRLTRGCPEDREAIARVRRHVEAWLAGEPGTDVSTEDVLTTAAALMAAIDRDLGGTVPDEDERLAIGAEVAA